MTTQEIIDSGFFKAIISEYVLYQSPFENDPKDALIYSLCESEEERKLATIEEINAIKKRIRELGYEDFSIDFLSRYEKLYPGDSTKYENTVECWIDEVHSFFIYEIENTLNPITLARKSLEEYPGIKDWRILGGQAMHAIEKSNTLSDEETRFRYKTEQVIMSKIAEDIESYKNEGSWDSICNYYQRYTDHNDALNWLFVLCELLVQLLRLRKFQRFLIDPDLINEIKQHDVEVRLQEYGFFDLPLVSSLSKEGQNMIFIWIRSKGLPYAIAMLDHVGFIKHLMKTSSFSSGKKLQMEIGKWFGRDDRTVRGHLNSLHASSKEKRHRYTAWKYKETVEKDYQTLN